MKEMHWRLTTEQRFIKVKRLASCDAVMDSWRVFFLDLLFTAREPLPAGNTRISGDAVNHRNEHLFCVCISVTINSHFFYQAVFEPILFIKKIPDLLITVTAHAP